MFLANVEKPTYSRTGTNKGPGQTGDEERIPSQLVSHPEAFCSWYLIVTNIFHNPDKQIKQVDGIGTRELPAHAAAGKNLHAPTMALGPASRNTAVREGYQAFFGNEANKRLKATIQIPVFTLGRAGLFCFSMRNRGVSSTCALAEAKK